MPNEGAPLGSVSLPAFVVSGGFDFSGFRAVARLAVRFLNDAIDATDYPSKEARALAKRRRRIGLGVMGYDTALRSLGLPYDAGEALALGEELVWHLVDAANDESRALARLHGPFDDFPSSDLGTARRNCALLSLAPTGGISSLWGVSSGIEPLFAAVLAKESGLVPMNLPDTESIQPPESIHWIWHLHQLVTWQRYVDGGISKTANVPATTSARQVLAVVIEAWRLGAKSISIFRKGSRVPGVRIT